MLSPKELGSDIINSLSPLARESYDRALGQAYQVDPTQAPPDQIESMRTQQRRAMLTGFGIPTPDHLADHSWVEQIFKGINLVCEQFKLPLYDSEEIDEVVQSLLSRKRS